MPVILYFAAENEIRACDLFRFFSERNHSKIRMYLELDFKHIYRKGSSELEKIKSILLKKIKNPLFKSKYERK